MELTPSTLPLEWKGYIPYNTLLTVCVNNESLQVTLLDMRIYPNRWLIMAKHENNIVELIYPRDKFYLSNSLP
jgi:hypothetical protein